MTRRSLAPAQTIEFLSQRFYLVVLRDPAVNGSSAAMDQGQAELHDATERLLSSSAGNAQFISLEEHLPPRVRLVDTSTPQRSGAQLDTRRSEGLDLSQTIQFCCFLSSWIQPQVVPSDAAEVSDDIPRSARAPRSSRVVDGTSTSLLPNAPPVQLPPGRSKIYFYLRRQHSKLDQEVQVVQLICSWRVLVLRLQPAEAAAPFHHFPMGLPLTHARVDLMGFLGGLEKSLAAKMFVCQSLDGFNHDEYRTLARDEYGGITWLSRKLLAFRGPRDPELKDDTEQPEGAEQWLAPEQIIPLLKQQRVSLVIRLNCAQYDERKFIDVGIDHMDLAASESEPEGAMMDETIVGRFLDACENASGVVAVHSSSSFGRAATCIGCYLMKHFHFSAREAIGWIRLCRPGSFSLAHQVFLGRMQQRMWTEGEEFKRIAGAYVMGTNPVNPPMDANVGNLSSRSLQINIGNISLEGDSLLGTREKKAASSNLPDTAVGANGSSSTGRPIASPAATNVARRRPFTQGSHRSHHRLSDSGHSGSLRGDLDFAAMHKFLHQSATPATATTVASGNIRSGRGGTLARPATTAPDLNIANKAECTF